MKVANLWSVDSVGFPLAFRPHQRRCIPMLMQNGVRVFTNIPPTGRFGI